MKIGVIGGSFDPVHTAHLVIAEAFAEQCNLHCCYVVPAAISPFKIRCFANNEARITMLKLAFANNERFVVDDREIRRGGASYTIETLIEYKQENPNADLYFLIGSDAFYSFTKWHKWKEIISIAQLCVANRPVPKSVELDKSDMQTTLTEISNNLPNIEMNKKYKPLLISSPLLEISSTDMRQRIAEGRTIRYLTPEAVRQYIIERELYIK